MLTLKIPLAAMLLNVFNKRYIFHVNPHFTWSYFNQLYFHDSKFMPQNKLNRARLQYDVFIASQMQTHKIVITQRFSNNLPFQEGK